VSFPFTINGNTYEEADVLGLGYIEFFPNFGADIAAVAVQVAADAATAASQGASLLATSTTSTLVGTGARTFTTQASKQYAAGMWVIVVRTSSPTTWMLGQVTSYSGTSLAISVSAINGSGTYTDWSIGVSGPQGAAGSITNLLTSAKTGAYTAVAGDKGTVIRCTNTWTLALTSAGTLASGWWCWVVNDGTGVITIDPSSTQQINGALTQTLYPGEMALLQCNGTLFTLDFPSGLRRLPIVDAETVGRTPVAGGQQLMEIAAGPGGAGNYPQINFGGSLFVAAPMTGTAAWTSPDGSTWTSRTFPASGAYSKYAYGAGLHLCSVSGSTTAASSPDGVTWTARTLGAAYNDITFGGSVFVGVAGTTVAGSSPDGIAWTPRTLPTSQGWTTAKHNGAVFLAIGGSSNNFATSTDGITWTARTGPAGVAASSSKLFVAGSTFVLAFGGLLYSSTDGITWTLAGSFPALPSNLGRINNVWIAVLASSGVYTSTDLATWVHRDAEIPTGSGTGGWSPSLYLAPASVTFASIYRLRSPSPVGLFAE
jgi:hypothetical protein